MNARPVAALGVALTTFLAVAALLTDLLAARIAFSAIVGLPVGLIAGAAAGIATWARLWHSPGTRPPLLGTAAFGYALLGAAAVSYAVPPARSFVSVGTALPFGVVCAVVAFLLARRYDDRIA
ncbi:hypothetical protein [Halorubrum lacusprofundi]|jgi:hypothetical protein|uniref:Integral membrane protein n=1 Tax=Halorubrum lacusprofundi (strain ATCC 49239 / DSM 5036 / JCM 8891 / ACAM 34) TaxID=416348 RepID=B9LNN0_HALLT|nr:hypothetical protein [Halorubrum lacusprofundi]ACM56968.1 putative integral membrane protein [Halorubrum lacusprofundi ATCC 49239]MCG1006603.1 hypothetical protein [Halorubrum lacusprofundi]